MKNTNTPPPSQPLENPKHERFAQLVANGEKQSRAYRQVYPLSNPDSSRANASQLRALPAVKNRIEYLKLAGKGPSEAINDTFSEKAIPVMKGRGAQEADNNAEPVTHNEVVLQLSKVIRRGAPSDINAAAGTLIKIMPELSGDNDTDKPDPLAVCNYLAHYAGIPGYDMVKDLGGLELLMRKFIDVLKVDVRDFAKMAATIARINPEGNDEAAPQRV